MDAFRLLCRTEGIIPAIESAHALAGAHVVARELGSGRRPDRQPLRARGQGHGHGGGLVRPARRPGRVSSGEAFARGPGRGTGRADRLPAGRVPVVRRLRRGDAGAGRRRSRRRRGRRAVQRPGARRPDHPGRRSSVALENGTTVRDVLRTVEAVAATGVATVVMTLLEPGAARTACRGSPRTWRRPAAQGLITPDLMPDEAADWLAASDEHDLDRIFLVAPSSTRRPDRDDGRGLPRLGLRRVDDGGDGRPGRHLDGRAGSGPAYPNRPRRCRSAWVSACRTATRRQRSRSYADGVDRRLGAGPVPARRRHRGRRRGRGSPARAGPGSRRPPGGSNQRRRPDEHASISRRIASTRDPGVNPQPVPGGLASRPGADPGVCAVHHRGHRRRRRWSVTAGSRRAVVARARSSRTSRPGRCRSAWSAPGCTTWQRTRSSTGARTAAGTIGAFKIWDGGLGIWGGVLFGALGACIACRRYNVDFAMRGRLAGAGPAAGAGRRPVGQLVQPGAVRPAHPPALGVCTSTSAHRMPAYRECRATTSRRSCTSRSGTSASRCW